MAVAFESIRVEESPPVARVVLAQPAVSNRIGRSILAELTAACAAISAREDISLVLVTAEGPDFSLGWDDDVRAGDVGLDPFGCLASLPIPVLCAVHGRVSSAGLELALACDIRVARDDARVGCPDMLSGRMPLGGAAARLPRIAGRTMASAMLLLGEEIDADAAYRCGLVSRVLPSATFTAGVDEMVGRITANGPLGLRYAKEAVVNGLELPLEHGLRYELDLSIILQTTHDRAEGVSAFLEKRRPEFEGR